LKSGANASVHEARVRRKDDLGWKGEVLSHESLTLKFAV